MTSLEWWFMWTIEDEEWLYRECEESKEAVVKGTEGRVLSSLTGLYLKLPYGYIDSYAKRATGCFEVFDSYFGKRNSFTNADLVVDTVDESALAYRGRLYYSDILPWNTHSAPCSCSTCFKQTRS